MGVTFCKPTVEYKEPGLDTLIYCAGICYGSENKDRTEKEKELFIEYLKKKNHFSVFRHQTIYFKLNRFGSIIKSDFGQYLLNNPYCAHVTIMDYVYFSTNVQFILNNEDFYRFILVEDLLTYEEVIDKPELKDIIRHTFIIETQISTARELNRVSPNNILEKSTRYCAHMTTRDNGMLKIVEPYWTRIIPKNKDYITIESLFEYNTIDKKDEFYDANLCFIDSCLHAANSYNELLCMKISSQQAREVLPLCTYTKVAYTYSLKEWKHIIDLRVNGITGKPHPNAEIVMTMVAKKLEKLTGEKLIIKEPSGKPFSC